MIVIASLQGVPAPTVVVQACGSSDQKLLIRLVAVIEALNQIAPALVFMDFIQNQQWFVSRQTAGEQQSLMVWNIPAQVRGRWLPGPLQQAQR